MLGIFSLFAHLKKTELSHWLTQLLVNIYIGPIQRKQKNDRFLESTKAIKTGAQRRAYGCSWIHWVDSVYPSKPNACRYRLSSLVFVFFFFVVVVAFLLSFCCCFVWFGFSVFCSRSFLEFCGDTGKWKKTLYRILINSDSSPETFHFFKSLSLIKTSILDFLTLL